MKRLQKQFLALCISVSLCSTALAGCGNSSEEAVAQTEATTEAQEATETTQEETTQEAEEATTVTDATDIYVEPVEGISDDFIRGMDASAVLVLENSGVKYYNFDGEEQDVFMTLSEAGVNYIRLRVWNDPYDENGNGYGGGNNDLPTAIELGRRATEYGMKVCIDFHYSDFWADPKRQHAPKAWEGMEIDEKCDALYDYTKDSLTQLLEEGVDVEMVQVGNEINNGMAGEYYLPDVTQLLKSGTKAVREIADTYNKDIQVVIHYTNIESNGEIDSLASNLQNNDVDYDIMGLSYYPFWDGSFDNMQRISKYIQKTYNKKVMIAETSYCYTSEDGDGSGNSLVGTDDIVKGYPATVQSQATMVRDVCAVANEAGLEGVFYWEGTWIPVGPATADNSPIWEKYGSGWASSYASDYDPDDAGLYYGGCSWDNQAMFDFTGHPLPSLNVFKYLKDGHDVPLAVDYVSDVSVTCNAGSAIELPEQVDVIFTATPQGLCASLINEEILSKTKIIDLSADFRLKDVKVYEEWYKIEHKAPQYIDEAVYGLCEINRDKVKDARIVANPGCYTTCSILTAYPLAKEGLIDMSTLIIDAKSGTSGAGRGAKLPNLYCEVNENIKAYGVATHRHTPEIEEQLGYAAGEKVVLNFTPHLVPMNRGILATEYAKLTKEVTYEEVKAIYDKYYADEKFVRVLDKDQCPETKWVEGSNYVDIGFKIDERTGRIIMMGAIDNLVKGAAGQAVQNMNLLFGLPESEGLELVPMFP